jgi:hypothetical protein
MQSPGRPLGAASVPAHLERLKRCGCVSAVDLSSLAWWLLGDIGRQCRCSLLSKCNVGVEECQVPAVLPSGGGSAQSATPRPTSWPEPSPALEVNTVQGLATISGNDQT